MLFYLSVGQARSTEGPVLANHVVNNLSRSAEVVGRPVPVQHATFAAHAVGKLVLHRPGNSCLTNELAIPSANATGIPQDIPASKFED